PTRVLNAARAPGSSASSQRTPLRRSHSISLRMSAPGGIQGDAQFLVAARDLAVELAAQRLVQPAAELRALRDALPQQVVPRDLERHMPPLVHVALEPPRPPGAPPPQRAPPGIREHTPPPLVRVAVEPLGAFHPRQHQLDVAVSAG